MGTAGVLVPSCTVRRPGDEVLVPVVDGIEIAGCEPGCYSAAQAFVGLEPFVGGPGSDLGVAMPGVASLTLGGVSVDPGTILAAAAAVEKKEFDSGHSCSP